MHPMRQLYLAATGMNRGKTTFALGLLAALIDRGLATGFIKPVGQRYAVVDGVPADEDAILVREALAMPEPLAQMSPVHIPRGFTKAFIAGEVPDDLSPRIEAAHRAFAGSHDVLLIEGTGHAGVGAVVGLSNAEVAARLGAPALIISEGGVGKPIDEIVLNHALFARRGVRVVGAIVNKVDIESQPALPGILRAGLARHGIELLGTLPYRPILSNPTLAMLAEQIPGEVLSEGEGRERVIERVAIGAMQPRHVLERLGRGTLLIVPGDRDDVIHATIAADRRGRAIHGDPSLLGRLRDRAALARDPAAGGSADLAGLVFTGGYRPREREIDALRRAGIFGYLVEEDTYPAASRVHDLLVKTHPADHAKIAEIRRLIAEEIDIERILRAFAPWEGVTDPGDRPPPIGVLRDGVREGARGLARLGDALRRAR